MKTDTVTTTSERVDKDRVKLRVEVPEDALRPALEQAYRRWARDVKVPGFRKGKVPRQLIDARVGADTVRQEALQEALPGFYRDALVAEELIAIAPPEIEVVDFIAGSPLVFEATVDVRPEVDVPDLSRIVVEAPPREVTDEDVAEQLERLRDRFAELDTVGREARRGDHVLIDLNGYRHDQPVEGMSAPDLLYEVGSNSGPPKLDDELQGTRPGAILKFNSEVVVPGEGGEASPQDVSFTVLVKEVKAKRLPPLDDEFAKTVGSFDSLEELRADLRERLAEVVRARAEEELRALVLERIVDASHLDPPARLVEEEFAHRLAHLEADLKRAGLTLEHYAREVGSTELELRKDLRSHARRSVKAELLLEEIARREGIDVTQEEIAREIAIAAARAERDPKEVAEQLMESGQISSVAADIMRRKALDFAVENVEVSGRHAAEALAAEESGR
jgi:trigger factor